MYGEEFVEDWYRNNHVEFENKLKQAIIDRFEDKNRLIQSNDINSMIRSIKDSKMALENELEDLKALRSEMRAQNKFSRKDAEQLNLKMQKLQARVAKLKDINIA